MDYIFINVQPYFHKKINQYQFPLYSGMHGLRQSRTKQRYIYSQENIVIQMFQHQKVSRQ